MKSKLFVKIFLILMIGVMCILSVSMYFGIKAQRNLYISYLQETRNCDELNEEIKGLLSKYGIDYSSEEYLKKEEIIDVLDNEEFINELNDIALQQGNGSGIYISFKDFENSGKQKMYLIALGTSKEDNYLILKNDDESEKYQSIDLEPIFNQDDLDLFLKINQIIKRQTIIETVSIEYNIDHNQVVYLEYKPSSTDIWTLLEENGLEKRVIEKGTPGIGERKFGVVYSYCINGTYASTDLLSGAYVSVDKNELIDALENCEYSQEDYYAESTYNLKEVTKGNRTYLIMNTKPTMNNSFCQINVVNVVDGLDGYVKSQYFESNTMLYFISFCISVVISIIISYTISKPIKKIEKSALKIADNEFDEVVKVRSHDEIGSLAQSVDRMRVQLSETISKLNAEIENVKKLESLRKDFINQFTHEMKTPLGIINGYSELIQESTDDKEKERYLEIINRETERINALIVSMLNLSRLEAGKVELIIEEIDLEDLVTEIIDEYEVLLMKKNIKIDIKVEDKLIYADKKQIATVIKNFLSNAIKHTYENGNIVIDINQGFSVYNEGQPIPEEQIENIWYTFVTHDKNGTGLGLAICRSILELHHFKYDVKNVDNGVCFYMKIKE